MADDRNDDDDKVGYRRPPQAHRFKPGQSGNPQGRPKGSKNHATILAEELDARLPYLAGGKRKTIQAHRMMIRQAVHKAAKGDQRAFESLSRMTFDAEVRRDSLTRLNDQLDADDAAAIAEIKERWRESLNPDDDDEGGV